MIKNFNVGVKALIINKNKALVLKEIDIGRGNVEFYDLPGGRIEEGEEIEEALKRELKEELGISEFTLGPLMFVSRHPHYDKNGTSLMLLFYKVIIENTAIKLSNEHVSFQWISQNDLDDIVGNKGEMHSGIKTALEKVLK